MSIYKNKTIIKIGNFFFKYRNKVFPLIIAALFLIMPPPTSLFESEGLERVKDILACLIAVSGLVIRGTVIGFAYIKRGGRNKQVYADNLVKEGMFSICRNPLYFGNMLIYSGVFLMHGALPVILPGIAIFYFIYICIIAAEEQYLRNKFGAEYDVYEATTNRWIINFTKFRTATSGMYFNYKKVILKDYPTIFTTLLILVIIEEYEDFMGGEIHSTAYQFAFAGFTIFCVSTMLIISYMKKNRILTA